MPLAATPSTPRELTLHAGWDPHTPPGAPMVWRIQLAWSPPDAGLPITGYRVEWAPSPGGPWTVLTVTTGHGATEDLPDGVRRFYRVSASNAHGYGPAATASAPGHPSPPLVTGAQPRPGGVELTWQPPSDDGGSPISGYVIEFYPYDPWTGAPTDITRWVYATRTTVTVAGLLPGGSYAFAVRAGNQAGLFSDADPIAAVAGW